MKSVILEKKNNWLTFKEIQILSVKLDFMHIYGRLCVHNVDNNQTSLRPAFFNVRSHRSSVQTAENDEKSNAVPYQSFNVLNL